MTSTVSALFGQIVVLLRLKLLTTTKSTYSEETKMVRIPTHRVPTHPGEMLRQEFLEPLNITQVTLAQEIGVSYQRINEIINGKRGITAATALRLAKFFGMSPDFWLNLQLRWDLYHAQKKEAAEIKKIEPLKL